MREPFSEFIEAKLEPGTLLIACGLPGTWKTETTEEVAKLKGYKILRTDLIRLEVLQAVAHRFRQSHPQVVRIAHQQQRSHGSERVTQPEEAALLLRR